MVILAQIQEPRLKFCGWACKCISIGQKFYRIPQLVWACLPGGSSKQILIFLWSVAFDWLLTWANAQKQSGCQEVSEFSHNPLNSWRHCDIVMALSWHLEMPLVSQDQVRFFSNSNWNMLIWVKSHIWAIAYLIQAYLSICLILLKSTPGSAKLRQVEASSIYL